jgi:hypothetical protein
VGPLVGMETEIVMVRDRIKVATAESVGSTA